jgi:hypothetical protein
MIQQGGSGSEPQRTLATLAATARAAKANRTPAAAAK